MTTETENLAATLARVLPTALVFPSMIDPSVMQFAVPNAMTLKEIDLERLLPSPRRTVAVAKFSDAASFIAYVLTHKEVGTTAWCKFDPQTFALSFAAVIDEHAAGVPGWRSHRAEYTPDMSAEWKAWKGKHAIGFSQVDFAEWLEEHAEDIAAKAGMPTGLDMLTMATNFHSNEERVLKSSVKLQSGGVRLTYTADADTGTVESMQMFDRFALGIPVFQGREGWGMEARLKYRVKAGSVSFFYELVRADRVHLADAKELIDQIRDAIGDVPLLMGAIA
ncbi:MAG: DUF2303 family protein [Ramlibacter sp.]|nr:DUF2303 family protein [Ramlibacter sp.]